MRVDEVIAGSTAERAGIKKGDLLISLAGEAVSDIPSFAAAIAARTGTTEIQLMRDGKTLTVSVNLRRQ
jgi:S1-C subfamily serine protease